jgi:Na+-transporting methylmalonyl-CoA/oxaloacetate decarboxylase beta subunit
MTIKETFKNVALTVLNGIGAAYVPAVPMSARQQDYNDHNENTKQGEKYECSQ